MRNNLLNKITLSFVALVITLITLPSGKAEAQYCAIKPIYGNSLPVGQINNFKLTNTSESTQVFERASGWDFWATIEETGTSSNPIELSIGSSYELEVVAGVYYYGYFRAYIDKNADGRWENNKIGPDEEYIGYRYMYSGIFRYPPTKFENIKFPFNIDDNVQEGFGVLRIMVNYSSYTSNPCELYYRNYYGYGDVEDYYVNFAAPVPETYPTAGNILYNKQRYDGTTRNFNGVPTDFRLPSVESKGPQPTGTLIEYWITGPLPSTEVVYRALDPNTGSQSIRYNTPTQTYTMQSATGSASVSTNEGTFKASKGGEYKVNVKLTKTSGKSAQGAKIFTVANNYDMSVANVESPRTSRFPRFFKYLVNTNIDVTCQVQNTGLNPVKRFEVSAKIYNANTNVLVSTLPKYVFDTENDPNLLPLQSGQKHEASFAAFSSYSTGEFYVQFEVTYTYDEEEYNNFLPRPDGEKHYFEVQHNDQLTAGEFESPISGQILKVNRPTTPKVVFLNNGISDASNINFHMVVKNEAGAEVYNEVSFLEDMPQGRYNEKLVSFPNMVIREPGTYTGSAWVDYPYDLVNDDDTTFVTFEVELGIQDTITVGDLNDKVNQTTNDGEMNSANDENISQRIESSVVDFNFNGFSINPASTTTVIRFNSKDALTLEVVDMNGNVIFTDIAKDGLYNLNVSNFANGAYTVLLRSANGIQSRQLSVVR